MQIQGLKFQFEAQIYSPVIQVQVDVARLRSILTRGVSVLKSGLRTCFVLGSILFFLLVCFSRHLGALLKIRSAVSRAAALHQFHSVLWYENEWLSYHVHLLDYGIEFYYISVIKKKYRTHYLVKL